MVPDADAPEHLGQVVEGSVVAKLARCGGAFDPLGCRAVDAYRADDIVAAVRALPGRWVFITLTVDRKLWTCPEAAYQRANEYVRKAIALGCPRGIYFAVLEVQTKTGDGWPHWHVLAWCPDARTADQVKADTLRGWRTRSESVDADTGEVVASVERIGFVDVQEVRDATAAGKYVAKYMVKAWDAVPPWMLDSTRRFRKVRLSNRAYDVLEGLHRHERHRGERKARTGTGRRTRTLLQRMASSGSTLQLFRAERHGRLRFTGTLPVPMESLFDAVTARRLAPVRLGKMKAMVFEVSPGFAALVRDQQGQWRQRVREAEHDRICRLRAAWARMQRRRTEPDGDDPE